MRYLIILFVVLLLVTCKNNTDSPDVVDFCCCENDENHTSIADYWSCEQLLDTAGLKLYPFEPFTDEEWRQLNYASKLERRQIPADYISGMSTKALFYQIAYTDLSGSMLMFNLPDKRLNMVSELLSRKNAGCTLINILRHINPVDITKDGGTWPEPSCFLYYIYLQLFAGHPEVINSMTDMDIDNFINEQMRCLEIHRNICENTDDEYCYCGDTYHILYGLGNVMIRYGYEPFIQTLPRNAETNELIWQLPTAQQSLRCNFQVINCIEQFLTNKK